MEANHRQATQAAYDLDAAGWTERRNPQALSLLDALMTRVDDRSRVLDLGCGPGWHLPRLGRSPFGLDSSKAMLTIARSTFQPTVGEERTIPLIQADLSQLPHRRSSFGGAWASRSLVHLARAEVPVALAELHRVLLPEAYFGGVVFAGDSELKTWAKDRLPGRSFSFWTQAHLRQVLHGAGFVVDQFNITEDDHIEFLAGRVHTLPDTIGANMTMLACGLNPSPSSADSGVGFYRGGNRFWPAALQAKIASVDRDPLHALRHHGLGMTDLVKRPTRRADEISPEEYEVGLDRVEEVVRWLRPKVVCFVGLAGYRAVKNKKAPRGWQSELFGGQPLYLMPSTSGLNAHDTLASLASHLKTAYAGPE